MSWLAHLATGISAFFIAIGAFLGLSHPVSVVTTPAVATSSPTSVTDQSSAPSMVTELSATTSEWVSVSDPRNRDYSEKDGKIYENLNGIALPGADPATIRVLVDLENASDTPGVAKDTQHVYSGFAVWSGADSATFAVPDQANDNGPLRLIEIFVDKAHVYFGNSVVPYADPLTFSVVGNVGTDFLDGEYFKDENHVFYRGDTESGNYVSIPVIVPGADSSTFRLAQPNPGPYGVISGYLSCGQDCEYDAQDKNHKYLNGQVVQ
jgi:hypothetical protein